MATQLHTIACLSSSAPPRIAEKGVGYKAGINGGILVLGDAPPAYQRTFTAVIPDTALSANWSALFTAKNAGTIIDVEGHGIAAKAVLLDFDWQVGPRSSAGSIPVTIVTIQAALAFAVTP
jgi:hypothetical protein